MMCWNSSGEMPAEAVSPWMPKLAVERGGSGEAERKGWPNPSSEGGKCCGLADCVVGQ